MAADRVVGARMRLTTSLVAAAALHGAVFGAAAVVLSRQAVQRPAPNAVEIDVVAPEPDPIAAALPAVRPAPLERPVSVTPRARASSRHAGEIASAREPAGAGPAIDPAGIPDAPAAPQVAPPAAQISKGPAGTSAGGPTVSATPRYRTNPVPDYPIPSRRRREEGVVLLNVMVQADGAPAAVSINRSSGFPLLDRAALDAVRRWTFEPARAGGLPVARLTVVPVRFSLEAQP